jgi:hypothetical protein
MLEIWIFWGPNNFFLKCYESANLWFYLKYVSGSVLEQVEVIISKSNHNIWKIILF